MAVDSSRTGGIGLTLCRLAISIQRGGVVVASRGNPQKLQLQPAMIGIGVSMAEAEQVFSTLRH